MVVEVPYKFLHCRREFKSPLLEDGVVCVHHGDKLTTNLKNEHVSSLLNLGKRVRPDFADGTRCHNVSKQSGGRVTTSIRRLLVERFEGVVVAHTSQHGLDDGFDSALRARVQAHVRNAKVVTNPNRNVTLRAAVVVFVRSSSNAAALRGIKLYKLFSFRH